MCFYVVEKCSSSTSSAWVHLLNLIEKSLFSSKVYRSLALCFILRFRSSQTDLDDCRRCS